MDDETDDQGPGARQATFAAAAEAARTEMEALSLEARDLVVRQPPVRLLGYVLSQLQLANMTTYDEQAGPDAEVLQTFQFVLEYLHAVWSTHGPLPDDGTPLDEAAATAMFETLGALSKATMTYCMASSAAVSKDNHAAYLAFHMKSAWALIRGHRYQVLEGEFFAHVLAPHDEALRQAYGMGSQDIADGLQRIADAFRAGASNAFEGLGDAFDRATERAAASTQDPADFIEILSREDPAFASSLRGSMEDFFFGGVCNLSRHSGLAPTLLADLSFEPGEEDRFFAPGPFSGTPMRALPARAKPGIKLGDDYYASDGQFVRDSAYRAIQWGLWKRLPYRETWLEKQSLMVERALPEILAKQLAGGRTHESVYYRDPATGDWTETDLIVIFEDVMIVVEAKAGAMPMHSPATNLDRHERVIRDLVTKAYQQCRRALTYLESAAEVPLYRLVDGVHVEIDRLRLSSFRRVFPIGLTVEAFTPFSAMAKEDPAITPILGRHPFMSMSVDDLFVLKRFLPTAGELMHYLEVRQAAAGVPGAMLFDEIDHLGAHVIKNRFDADLQEQRDQAQLVAWTHFNDVIDRHFEGPDWDTRPPPQQTYPEFVVRLLEALDRLRPPGWLLIDGCLRDLGGEGRTYLSDTLEMLAPTLAEFPRRRFQMGEEEPFQIWLCRQGSTPTPSEVRRHGEIGCLTVGTRSIPVLIASLQPGGVIDALSVARIPAPLIIRSDFGELQAEAEIQKKRMVGPQGPSGS